ncbi:uncharacterized protein N7515_000499 [Penicillium bovifimosum]|uniref:Uncharacterized protein n=1 Tax=Penicillium bovifimosum TaxID=126998 RepID=A0A9W9HHG0_9EURO|nr:uncharacterized protein N7515_000499 [Penicillium bovifimosum]KAJ5145935.1 hypothetical protein N7515_000499 [Penicillium bovifimosum]
MNIEYVKILPRFHDLIFNSKDLDKLTDLPVLGILHFTFHPGVDIADTQQCAAALWRKSLKYVLTIPGFERLLWSPVNDTSTSESSCQQVVVLIQWNDVPGWKLFQLSLGFSMMLGYISQASSSCIQYTLPLEIPSPCYLELVSFQFSATPSTPQVDGRTGFKVQWDNTFSPPCQAALSEAGLVHAGGEWLERDTDYEDLFFVGLIFWNLGTGGSQSILANRVSPLVENASSTVSLCTNQLAFVSPDDASILQPSNSFTGCEISKIRHPAFQKPVQPRYSLHEDLGTPGTSVGKDICHVESMSLARQEPPERIAAGPAGAWYRASTISQHHIPLQARFQFPCQGLIKTGTYMISFWARRGNQHVQSSFEALRMGLWKLGDCPLLIWGEDPAKEMDWTKIMLFIGECRRDLSNPVQSNEDTYSLLQQHLQEFSEVSGDDIQHLQHRMTASPQFVGKCSDADITFYEMRSDENDRRAFVYAMTNYGETLNQQVIQGRKSSPWSALEVRCSSWVPVNPRFTGGDDIGPLSFASVFSPQKEGAREEWYNDFAERAQTQYDLLGKMEKSKRT